MHTDEAQKLIEQLRQRLGDERVVTATAEEIARLAVDEETELVMMPIDSGNHEQALQSAQAANNAVAVNPNIKLMFGINGVMDDPREVDEIPEARATLAAFFLHLRPAAYWRFNVEQQALMLVAVGVGVRRGTELHVPPELIRGLK